MGAGSFVRNVMGIYSRLSWNSLVEKSYINRPLHLSQTLLRKSRLKESVACATLSQVSPRAAKQYGMILRLVDYKSS